MLLNPEQILVMEIWSRGKVQSEVRRSGRQRLGVGVSLFRTVPKSDLDEGLNVPTTRYETSNVC